MMIFQNAKGIEKTAEAGDTPAPAPRPSQTVRLFQSSFFRGDRAGPDCGVGSESSEEIPMGLLSMAVALCLWRI